MQKKSKNLKFIPSLKIHKTLCIFQNFLNVHSRTVTWITARRNDPHSLRHKTLSSRGRPNVTLIVSAETETGPKVYALHSAETKSQPKV